MIGRALITLLCVLPALSFGTGPDPDAILGKIITSVTPARDEVARVRITPCSGTGGAPATAFYFRTGVSDSWLLIYVAPDPMTGTGLLSRGKELFAYAPGAGLFFDADQGDVIASPVSAAMGALDARIPVHYRTLGVEEAEIGIHPCYKLVLRALDDSLPFPGLSLWALRDSYVPVKAEFAD
jgi:hypothetical protein